ncbi:MAG: GNAT family N-acetyltransferase [Acinetobacter sp.]
MIIREVILQDALQVCSLLEILEYKLPEDIVRHKLAKLLAHPDEYCFVVENDQQNIVALISISIIFQLALTGDFARISYFSVDEQYQSQGIGTLLERKCVEIAKMRGCNRIEVHCHSRRLRAHHFYEQHGFIESPKYFIKMLNS